MRPLILACAVLFAAPSTVSVGSSFALLGYQELLPTSLHIAIYHMVAKCMGREAALRVAAWGAADAIIDLDTGAQAYGATVMVTDTSAVVILERAHWLDARVISHEMIHIVGGLELGERTADPAWRCEIAHRGSLDPRPLIPRDSIRALLAKMGRAPFPDPDGL